jgi:hypothetical protein
MKHVRDHKNYNTLIIKAFFKIINRDITLDLNLKDKNKSRLDIVQMTPLFHLNPPFNNVFNEFILDIVKLLISNIII